jgi:hypothetical protein
MPTTVATRSFDNTRRNVNLQETTLTQAGVAAKGIRKFFSVQMPGDSRGTEGAMAPRKKSATSALDTGVSNVV